MLWGTENGSVFRGILAVIFTLGVIWTAGGLISIYMAALATAKKAIKGAG
mgnify:FL=1|jgi:hypothetical protein|tara:strand:- start:5200 stop:5349 length:150 start_codon:yes stop_codon:yes gene_type:complete